MEEEGAANSDNIGKYYHTRCAMLAILVVVQVIMALHISIAVSCVLVYPTAFSTLNVTGCGKCRPMRPSTFLWVRLK